MFLMHKGAGSIPSKPFPFLKYWLALFIRNSLFKLCLFIIIINSLFYFKHSSKNSNVSFILLHMYCRWKNGPLMDPQDLTLFMIFFWLLRYIRIEKHSKNKKQDERHLYSIFLLFIRLIIMKIENYTTKILRITISCRSSDKPHISICYI